MQSKKRKNITYEEVKNSLIRESYTNKSASNKNDIHYSENQNKIENEIQRLNINYKNVKITKIKRMSDDTICIGTNSHFCMNKNAEHDNHVYFVVNKKKIYQKCFCSNNKTEQRQFGKCAEYKSKGFPFSWLLYNELKLSIGQ